VFQIDWFRVAGGRRTIWENAIRTAGPPRGDLVACRAWARAGDAPGQPGGVPGLGAKPVACPPPVCDRRRATGFTDRGAAPVLGIVARRVPLANGTSAEPERSSPGICFLPVDLVLQVRGGRARGGKLSLGRGREASGFAFACPSFWETLAVLLCFLAAGFWAVCCASPSDFGATLIGGREPGICGKRRAESPAVTPVNRCRGGSMSPNAISTIFPVFKHRKP